MRFSKLIKARYSCRAYRPDPIDERIVAAVVEAARLAPTASNRQPFQLIIVRTRGRETELRRVYDREWFVQAPMVICACGVPAEAWVRKDGANYYQVDVAIAMDHLILAAADLGLGTCWIAAFDAAAARDVLGLPPEIEPVVFTPLGYPADEPKPKERKPAAELVRYDRW